MMNRLSIFVAVLVLTVLMLDHTAHGGTEMVASQSLTIQPTGPRSGDPGKKYFNVEGKDNEKFASLGVLVFDVPKDVQEKKVKGLTLTLIQTSPKFAKEGAIKLFLAPDLDSKAELKFDAETPGGVGKQIEPLEALGTGEFKNPEQGKTQSFRLTLNDAVRDRIAKGGKLCLVIVPADGTVAATYYGADEEAKDKSPKLTLDLP
jgi:hypothetical protein